MNPAIENMLTRRSIRKYKPDMIPTDIIKKNSRSRNICRNGKKQNVTDYISCNR